MFFMLLKPVIKKITGPEYPWTRKSMINMLTR
jgi:hypothetical protein